MESGITDELLMGRVKEGSVAAFEEVVRRWELRIFTNTTRWTPGRRRLSAYSVTRRASECREAFRPGFGG